MGRRPRLKERCHLRNLRAAEGVPIECWNALPRSHDVTDLDLIVTAVAGFGEELQGTLTLNVVRGDEPTHYVITHDQQGSHPAPDHLPQGIVDGELFGDR
jgi:hypothetical protein